MPAAVGRAPAPPRSAAARTPPGTAAHAPASWPPARQTRHKHGTREIHFTYILDFVCQKHGLITKHTVLVDSRLIGPFDVHLNLHTLSFLHFDTPQNAAAAARIEPAMSAR